MSILLSEVGKLVIARVDEVLRVWVSATNRRNGLGLLMHLHVFLESTSTLELLVLVLHLHFWLAMVNLPGAEGAWHQWNRLKG